MVEPPPQGCGCRWGSRQSRPGNPLGPRKEPGAWRPTPFPPAGTPRPLLAGADMTGISFRDGPCKNYQTSRIPSLSSTLLYTCSGRIGIVAFLGRKIHRHESVLLIQAHFFYARQAGSWRKRDITFTNIAFRKEWTWKLLETKRGNVTQSVR